ncbi:cuticle protein 21-like [Penaeus monodon]|uniref:cuticle protein 21-like n=1 Tax=Penaeus monodon TaxID=6687 RepID=UPI0018A6FF27|nr:cuticle protein 21-like [Penaeus monodon]
MRFALLTYVANLLTNAGLMGLIYTKLEYANFLDCDPYFDRYTTHSPNNKTFVTVTATHAHIRKEAVPHLSYQIIALASLLAAASAKPGLSQSYQAPGSSFGGSAGDASFLRPAAGPTINFGGAASGGAYNPPVASTRPQYNFNYAVNDAFGNDFGHQEGRDGYNTQGSYYVQLPDGRLQRVIYTVNGDQGYVAQVTYEGVAQYPAFQPSASYSPAPSYG